MGKVYNADRYAETENAIRFAHEGGTQWASADNKEKNNLAQFRANADGRNFEWIPQSK